MLVIVPVARHASDAVVCPRAGRIRILTQGSVRWTVSKPEKKTYSVQLGVGRAHVAYLPARGRVTGLSKLARTVDVFARRPQMQERLTAQIADALVEHLDPRGVAVIVEGEHTCLKLRGACKQEAEMVTTAFCGALQSDRALRHEVVSLLTGRR